MKKYWIKREEYWNTIVKEAKAFNKSVLETKPVWITDIPKIIKEYASLGSIPEIKGEARVIVRNLRSMYWLSGLLWFLLLLEIAMFIYSVSLLGLFLVIWCAGWVYFNVCQMKLTTADINELVSQLRKLNLMREILKPERMN